MSGSLIKGARVIAQGRLRQTSWTDREGQQRTGFVLDVDEIGPSLRYATAQVTRAQRNGQCGDQPQGGASQWAGQKQTARQQDQQWTPQQQGGQPPAGGGRRVGVSAWARDLSVSTLKITLRSGEWTTDGVPLGFRSTTTPPGAARLVRDLTDWLLLHLDQIAAHAGGPAFLDEVAVAIEAVYSRFPLEARPDRPPWRRPCEVYGELAVTADWAPDAEIRDVTVWSESCSHVLVSTTKDGSVNTAEGATADQRVAAWKLTRIVRQIAVGTSVPRVEGAPA